MLQAGEMPNSVHQNGHAPPIEQGNEHQQNKSLILFLFILGNNMMEL
jgi:hypothetical protein